MSTKMGTKMNAKRILAEMDGVLIRYRAGLLSSQDARQELSILAAMHKAYDTVVIEERISLLESVMEGRNNGR